MDDFGGAARMVELCEGGSSKPVTAENREEYVEAYAQHLLTSCIAPQFDAFKRGFDKVGFPACRALQGTWTAMAQQRLPNDTARAERALPEEVCPRVLPVLCSCPLPASWCSS